MTNTILITGNTYPVKDSIKALGGRWDAVAKGWRVPADKAQQAQALVAGAPKSAPRATSSYASSRPTGWRGSSRRTGCSCGSREDSSGELIPSRSNCKSCNFDAYDC